MSIAGLGKRFLESTRGQIVVLLRRGPRTVEELAGALGLTDNAVRNHLSVLDRDGLVRQSGVRRGPGAGKPAVLYEVHPDAEPLFSTAYEPVLTAMIDVLVEELPAGQAVELLHKVGRRVAAGAGGQAAGTSEQRANTAAGVLRSLGGDVKVAEEDSAVVIRSSGCPLSATVTSRPEMCRAVVALVSEIVGAPVEECCDRADRPRCCFRILPAA